MVVIRFLRLYGKGRREREREARQAIKRLKWCIAIRWWCHTTWYRCHVAFVYIIFVVGVAPFYHNCSPLSEAACPSNKHSRACVYVWVWVCVCVSGCEEWTRHLAVKMGCVSIRIGLPRDADDTCLYIIYIFCIIVWYVLFLQLFSVNPIWNNIISVTIKIWWYIIK